MMEPVRTVLLCASFLLVRLVRRACGLRGVWMLVFSGVCLSVSAHTLAAPVAAETASDQASSLADVLAGALEKSPQWQQIQFEKAAADEAQKQAKATLLPSLRIDAQAFANDSEQRIESIGTTSFSYHSRATTVTLSQPLLHLDHWFRWQQAKATQQVIDANQVAALEEFMLAIAERYFAVLKAQEALDVSKAEKQVVGQQARAAKKRLALGSGTQLDWAEAQAALDLARAKIIDARSEWAVARHQLNAQSGYPVPALQKPHLSTVVAALDPSVALWVREALEKNARLKSARAAVLAAKQQRKAAAALRLPKLDVVASQTNSHEVSFFSTASTPIDSDQSRVGLTLTAPLYAGGGLQSQDRQATQQVFALEAAEKEQQQQLMQQVAVAQSRLSAAIARARAQQEAIASTRSAWEATEAGYQVGTRHLVDVLNAHRTFLLSQQQYINTRYDYLLQMLLLKQAAGVLTVQDFVDLEAL